MPRQIPWARLLVESVLIVLSILLAFGIDAWWDNRGDRRREASALVGLKQDFEGHLSRVRTHQTRFHNRLQSADEVLATIGPSASAASASTIKAIAIVGIADPVSFQGGTLETLVKTSGLSLLRDSQLRTELIRWSQAIEDLAGINDFVINEAVGFIDYLRSRYPLQDLDRAGEIADDVPPSGFSVDATHLLQDLEFANAVYQQRYATQVILSRLDSLAVVAEGVLSIVRRPR